LPSVIRKALRPKAEALDMLNRIIKLYQEKE
jgi:hypothetical protein